MSPREGISSGFEKKLTDLEGCTNILGLEFKIKNENKWFIKNGVLKNYSLTKLQF